MGILPKTACGGGDAHLFQEIDCPVAGFGCAHRFMAPEPFSVKSYDDYGARQRGYMRKQDVIAIFEANGFELAGESEVNANPNDPANWPNGVWTLPPVLATGANDPKRSEYMAIGESDRMTLLFKKAD